MIQAGLSWSVILRKRERFRQAFARFNPNTVVKSDGRSLVASSPLSEQISKEMKRRGFTFVGPTIVYAWMQAVGIVNDHAAGCFRRNHV